MRKDPSNPKYIRVEVRVDPIVRELIRIEVVVQTVETEDNMETIDLDKTIETIIFEGTLEDMEDKITEKNTEIIGTMNITGAEIGQEKEIYTLVSEIHENVDLVLDIKMCSNWRA